MELWIAPGNPRSCPGDTISLQHVRSTVEELAGPPKTGSKHPKNWRENDDSGGSSLELEEGANPSTSLRLRLRLVPLPVPGRNGLSAKLEAALATLGWARTPRMMKRS